MDSTERARRWLTRWLRWGSVFEKLDPWVAFTPESEADLAREFDAAQAEALLEGLKAAEPYGEDRPLTTRPPAKDTWGGWFRNRTESDIDNWP